VHIFSLFFLLKLIILRCIPVCVYFSEGNDKCDIAYNFNKCMYNANPVVCKNIYYINILIACEILYVAFLSVSAELLHLFPGILCYLNNDDVYMRLRVQNVICKSTRIPIKYNI